jgi:hypothetical protein
LLAAATRESSSVHVMISPDLALGRVATVV